MRENDSGLVAIVGAVLLAGGVGLWYFNKHKDDAGSDIDPGITPIFDVTGLTVEFDPSKNGRALFVLSVNNRTVNDAGNYVKTAITAKIHVVAAATGATRDTVIPNIVIPAGAPISIDLVTELPTDAAGDATATIGLYSIDEAQKLGGDLSVDFEILDAVGVAIDVYSQTTVEDNPKAGETLKVSVKVTNRSVNTFNASEYVAVNVRVIINLTVHPSTFADTQETTQEFSQQLYKDIAISADDDTKVKFETALPTTCGGYATVDTQINEQPPLEDTVYFRESQVTFLVERVLVPENFSISTDISPSGAGSITKSPDETQYDRGETVVLTATPASGYVFDYWELGGYAATLPDNPITLVMDTNWIIKAVFKQQAPTTYTITSSASTGGSIYPVGSIQVPKGSAKQFVVTAAAGYHIANIVVDGASVGVSSSYTFQDVLGDHSITAYFEQDYVPPPPPPPPPTTYDITATVSGGSGAISPSGIIPVRVGGNQTFTFAPSSGYFISAVYVNGIGIGSPTSYTFQNVQSDQYISVVFSVIPTTTKGSARIQTVFYDPGGAMDGLPLSGMTVRLITLDYVIVKTAVSGSDGWTPVMSNIEQGAYIVTASSPDLSIIGVGYSTITIVGGQQTDQVRLCSY